MSQQHWKTRCENAERGRDTAFARGYAEGIKTALAAVRGGGPYKDGHVYAEIRNVLEALTHPAESAPTETATSIVNRPRPPESAKLPPDEVLGLFREAAAQMAPTETAHHWRKRQDGSSYCARCRLSWIDNHDRPRPCDVAPTETATAAARKCIACNGTGEVTELYHEYAPTQVKCDECGGSGAR